MRGENLYCPEQRHITDIYRNNYDLIDWTPADGERYVCDCCGEVVSVRMKWCPKCKGEMRAV